MRRIGGYRWRSAKKTGDEGESMRRDWKKWAAEKNLQKWFQKDNLIVLVLAGILLVIIALPTKGGGDSDGEREKQQGTSSGSGIMQPGPEKEDGQAKEDSGADENREYADYLEERLTETLSQMADVGKVKVMITLKSSCELVVEKEQPVNRSTTNENDSQGGTRIVSQMESQENTVYRTEGSTSEPYVIKTLPPQIEGVVVVAEGAGSGTVNRSIVDIVQALFGLEAHKVRVVKMGTKE